jgi:hypothetical protein
MRASISQREAGHHRPRCTRPVRPSAKQPSPRSHHRYGRITRLRCLPDGRRFPFPCLLRNGSAKSVPGPGTIEEVIAQDHPFQFLSRAEQRGDAAASQRHGGAEVTLCSDSVMCIVFALGTLRKHQKPEETVYRSSRLEPGTSGLTVFKLTFLKIPNCSQVFDL